MIRLMILCRDGSQLPMEVFLTRIQLAGRQIIQAVCNDITVRKRAEADLRESEARLRESEQSFSRAFRASPALMTIARLSDGKFVEANGAFVRWFGLDGDGILGHDSWELGLWLNLDARTKFWAELTPSKKLRRTGRHGSAARPLNEAVADSGPGTQRQSASVTVSLKARCL
jgi:PAS domain-containing protein